MKRRGRDEVSRRASRDVLPLIPDRTSGSIHEDDTRHISAVLLLNLTGSGGYHFE